MTTETLFTADDLTRALAALDALIADTSLPVPYVASGPALAIARAAVHRADMWTGYVNGSSGGDADEEYHAFELADAALDDATAVLIAALAEPPA